MRGKAVVTACVVGHIFPESAGRLCHRQEKREHLVCHLVITAVTEEQLQTQIVSDKGVRGINLGIFSAVGAARAGLRRGNGG